MSLYFQHQTLCSPRRLQSPPPSLAGHQAPDAPDPSYASDRPRAPSHAPMAGAEHRHQQTEADRTLRLCGSSVRPGDLPETLVRPHRQLNILFRSAIRGKKLTFYIKHKPKSTYFPPAC